MIIDRIENSELYNSLHKDFAKAFEFLRNVKPGDFNETAKIKIEGDRIFALLNDYITKDMESAKLEAHKKYIDIQYMLEGEELIGYSILTQQIPCDKYNSKSDIMFFSEKPLFFSKITQGMFSILYPQDLHMPGIKTNSPAPIKKTVVKILI